MLTCMVTDRSIIRYELDIIKDMGSRKDVYIIAAARKLEGKYTDTSCIAEVLVQLLSNNPYRVSRQYIMSCLPAEYKKPPAKKQRPQDLFEEVLTHADEAYTEIRMTNRKMLKLYRSKTPAEQRLIIRQFEDIIHETHGKFGSVYKGMLQEMANMDSLQTLMDAIDNMKHDAHIIRRMSDPRIKLRRWLKIRLKSAYLTHTTGHISHILGISHTWSKKIRHTPAYDAFMKELAGCPKCGYDLCAYIDKADAAFKAGKPIPSPMILPKKGLPFTYQ